MANGIWTDAKWFWPSFHSMELKYLFVLTLECIIYTYNSCVGHRISWQGEIDNVAISLFFSHHATCSRCGKWFLTSGKLTNSISVNSVTVINHSALRDGTNLSGSSSILNAKFTYRVVFGISLCEWNRWAYIFKELMSNCLLLHDKTTNIGQTFMIDLTFLCWRGREGYSTGPQYNATLLYWQPLI